MLGLKEADRRSWYDSEPELEPEVLPAEPEPRSEFEAHAEFIDSVLDEYESTGNEPEEPRGIVVREGDPEEAVQDPKQLIAELKKEVAEKDYALLQASLANVDLRQELDSNKNQAVELQEKLTRAVKTNESLTSAAAQAASTRGTWRTDADAARMEQQFRLAQKALEREHARVKDELVLTKGELHRANQQLEAHNRARRLEAAQASAKISQLERQVEETVSAAHAAGAEHSQSGARIRTRLSLAAALAAVVMLGLGIWSQFGNHTSPAQQQAHSDTSDPEIHAARYVTPSPSTGSSSTGSPSSGVQSSGSQSAPADLSQFGGGSQAAFQRSLGRLNNALSIPVGRTPEQLLREVRQRGSKAGVRVCDFEWNGGQPAVVYGGSGGLSLDASLNRCAAAVEDFVNATPAQIKNNGTR